MLVTKTSKFRFCGELYSLRVLSIQLLKRPTFPASSSFIRRCIGVSALLHTPTRVAGRYGFHRHLFVYQVTKIVPALGLCTLVSADFFQLLVCCCNADVNARSRFVAKTTESEASVYVGVVAIFLTVIPVCLIIVVDVITVANSNTTRRRLQYGHRRFAR